jgi:hypothetical protein
MILLVIVSLILASSTTILLLTPKQTLISTFTQTDIIESQSTLTVVSVATLTTTLRVAAAQSNQLNASDYPTTCVNQYPLGINLNQSTLLVMTSPGSFAQVCIEYVYDNALNLSSYNASFAGEMMISEQMGGSSMALFDPALSQVTAYPHNIVFNKTGESATVTYTMTTSNLIFEYFRPDYYCSAYEGIPISEINGSWTSMTQGSCGPLIPFETNQKIVGLTNLVIEGN